MVQGAAGQEGITVPVTSICSVLVAFKTKRMESWRKFSSECSKSQNRAWYSDVFIELFKHERKLPLKSFVIIEMFL